MVSTTQTNNGDGGMNVVIENVHFRSGKKLPELTTRTAQIVLALVPHVYNVNIIEPPLQSNFKIKEKIKINNLQKYKDTVLEIGLYMDSIEEVFDNIEKSSPGIKGKYCMFINRRYKEIKNEVGDVSIQGNADIIFNKMRELIESYSIDKCLSIPKENLDDTINLLLARFFINCQILEKPPI